MEKIYDNVKALLLNHLKKFADNKPVGKTVHLWRYDALFEECVTQTFTLERVFVEDGEVLVALRDNDGDYEECYARDFSLDDIVEIIKAVEVSSTLIPTKVEGLFIRETENELINRL